MSESRRRVESPSCGSKWRELHGHERVRRSRSRSRSRSGERSNRDYDRHERTRSSGDRHRRASEDRPVRMTNGDYDKLDRLVAAHIQELAAVEVQKYVESEDFKAMVESLKRRERERMLSEVEKELAQEKASLLMEGRINFTTDQAASTMQHPATHHDNKGQEQEKNLSAAEQADAILLQNKLKMEDLQRRNYEAKQKEDAERLQQVLHRKQIEDLLERQRLEALMREQDLLEEVLQQEPTSANGSDSASTVTGAGENGTAAGTSIGSSSGKLSFGLKKRNALC